MAGLALNRKGCVGRDYEHPRGFIAECQSRVTDREALERASCLTARPQDHPDRLEKIALFLLGTEAQSDRTVRGPHARELRANERETFEIEMSFEESSRVEIEIGFGRLGDNPAFSVEDLGPEHDQIDPALRSRPLEHRLIEADDDSGNRVIDGVLDGPCKGAQRNRAHQQPQCGTAQEKEQGSHYRADDQDRALYM